jgi:hypothetical protein
MGKDTGIKSVVKMQLTGYWLLVLIVYGNRIKPQPIIPVKFYL